MSIGNNCENLEGIARIVKRANITKDFGLVFAVCNDLEEQESYVEKLRQRCSEDGIILTEIKLLEKNPLKKLLPVIKEHLANEFRDGIPEKLGIQVTGLELSILLDADEQSPAVLQILNMNRESFYKDLPFPIIFWLPEYACIKLANVAPDFWSFRLSTPTFCSGEISQISLPENIEDGKTISIWQDKVGQIPVLERLLSTPQSPGVMVDLFIKSGDAYYYIGKTEKARHQYEKAIKVNQDANGEPQRVAEAYNKLGIIYSDMGNDGESLKKAVQALQQYLEIVEQTNRTDLITVAYNHLGLVHDKHREYTQALKDYEQSLDISRKFGHRKAEGDVLGNMGLLYRKQKKYKEALEMHTQALDISRELDDIHAMVLDLSNIGLVYFERAEYNEAIDYYNQSRLHNAKIGNKWEEMNQLIHLGDAWKALGDYPKALENFLSAKEIAEEININIFVVLDCLIELFGSGSIGDADRQILLINEAIERSSRSGQITRELQYQEKLCVIYRDRNEITERNNCLMRMEALIKKQIESESDKILCLEKLKEICGELEKKELVEKYNRELEELKYRQVIFWFDPGTVQMEKLPLTLQVGNNYKLNIQVVQTLPKLPLIHRIQIPFFKKPQILSINEEQRLIEGRRISTEKPVSYVLNIKDSEISQQEYVYNMDRKLKSDEIKSPESPPFTQSSHTISFHLKSPEISFDSSKIDISLSECNISNVRSIFITPKSIGNHRISVNVRAEMFGYRSSFEFLLQGVRQLLLGEIKTHAMIKEVSLRAKAHLHKKEFNEGLAVLEDLPDGIPDSDYLRQELEQGKLKEIDILLKQVEDALLRKDIQAASEFLRKAQALDNNDSRVRSAAERMQNALTAEKYLKESDTRKQRARNLLTKSAKTLEDLDAAIRILQEITAATPGDFDAGALLTDAQKMRADFLRSKGQVATLEQAGEFEDALKEINDMIQRGFTEIDHESIYDSKAQLEKKNKDFAEEKAAKYFKMAEDALDKNNNPYLAARYIETGLSLPWIPKTRRDAFEDLKKRVEVSLEKHKDAEKLVREARDLMVQQKYEAAISRLESALARVPGHIEAETFLKLAQQGKKDLIVNEARVVIARVESELNIRNIPRLRDNLLTVIARLGIIGPEGESLLARCKEIFGEIERREQREETFKQALEKSQKALLANDIAVAQWEIDALEKEFQQRPEIIAIRTELAKKQDMEKALFKAQQTFEEGNLESAQKQLMALREWAPQDYKINTLYKQVQSTTHFNEGTAHINNGNIHEAKTAFKKVLSLESLYLEETRDYLRQINEQSEHDRAAIQVFESAQKNHESQRYKEAYDLLEKIDQAPSSIKSKIKTLRTSVRNKWRSQLIKQVRSCLKSSKFDEIVNLVDHLKMVLHAEDTSLINDAYKHFHIHQAQQAEKEKNWFKAQQCWEAAQEYDNRDPQIQKGLLDTKKQKALREADAAPNENETIRILEEVVDRWYADLDDLDFQIEERLYEAYLLVEDFTRALSFAAARLHHQERFAAKAKTIRELCFQLTGAKDKYQVGALRESIDRIHNCLEKFPEYAAVLERLTSKYKNQAIETLLNKIKEMEAKEEKSIQILPIYRDVLGLEPDHAEAKQKYAQLMADLNKNISDILHDSREILENENATPEEIEIQIAQIQELIPIANENNQTGLKNQLDQLTRKKQTCKSLIKRFTEIEGLLAEAREDGDFKPVELEFNKIADIASQQNSNYVKLRTKFFNIRDRRKKCEEKTTELEIAFKKMDFSAIEHLAEEIKNLDEDDEFFLQRRRLKFEDTYANKKIEFKELKDWARTRRQNLERLNTWFSLNTVNTAPLVSLEKKARNEYGVDFDKRKLGQELQLLAARYKTPIDPLGDRPEAPLSEPARQVIENADRLIKDLEEKARQLEEEARTLQQDEEKIKALLDKIADLINNKKDYSSAKLLVDEALDISPGNPLFRHFRGVIENALQ